MRSLRSRTAIQIIQLETPYIPSVADMRGRQNGPLIVYMTRPYKFELHDIRRRVTGHLVDCCETL